MNLDVENIANKKQNKLDTNIRSYWSFVFLATNIFPTEFLDQCKNNPNSPQNIPSEVKVALKIMSMEQGVYAQVVMICRKESDNKKEK